MKANKFFKQRRSLKHDNLAIAAQLGMVVALLVSILVGVLVYYQIAKSSNDTTNTPTGRSIRAGYNVTNATASTVFTLAPIVGIVAIAGIILYIVTRFGQGMG